MAGWVFKGHLDEQSGVRLEHPRRSPRVSSSTSQPSPTFTLRPLNSHPIDGLLLHQDPSISLSNISPGPHLQFLMAPFPGMLALTVLDFEPHFTVHKFGNRTFFFFRFHTQKKEMLKEVKELWRQTALDCIQASHSLALQA